MKGSKGLELDNALHTIEYLQKNLDEQSAVLKKYKRSEKICHRIKSVATWPVDKAKELNLYDELKKGKLKNGLNQEKRNPRIVISLTSFPERICAVPAAIATLLKQSMKPDVIVLWLAEEQFPDRKLPKIFRCLREAGVKIRFCPDYRSHKKYFNAFKYYKNEIVITVDDDIMYEDDVIEKLYLSYLKHPEAVSALGIHRMRFGDDAAVKGWTEWIGGYIDKKRIPSHQLFATGSAGILYPPNAVSEEIFNSEAMMRLCPTHDDLWVKIMEVIKGTKVVSAEEICRTHGTVIRGTQRNLALGIVNLTLGGNDRQMDAVLKEYNDWYQEALLTEIMAYDLDVSGFTKNRKRESAVCNSTGDGKR